MSPRTGPCRKGRARHVKISHRQESPDGDGGHMARGGMRGKAHGMRTLRPDFRTSFISVVHFFATGAPQGVPAWRRDAGGKVGARRTMAGSTTVKATGNKAIDGLLSGLGWDGPLVFGFPTNAGDYGAAYGSGEPMRGFAALSVTARDAVRAALLGTPNGSGKAALSGMGVAQFTLLDIAEVASSADIRLAESSRPPTAWAYMPGGGIGGDVWFGTAYAGTIFDYRNPVLGNYAYVTVLHELGHALGLKHAQEAGGVAATAVPSAQDSLGIHRHDLPVLCRRPDNRLQLRAMGRAAELHDARHRRIADDVRRRFRHEVGRHDLLAGTR